MICSLPDGQRIVTLSTFAAFAKPEVQAALVLRRIAAGRDDLLELLLSFPLNANLGADGIAIARIAFKLEFDPIAARFDVISGRATAGRAGWRRRCRDSPVLKVRQGDGAAIVGVRGADGLGDFGEIARPRH